MCIDSGPRPSTRLTMLTHVKGPTHGVQSSLMGYSTTSTSFFHRSRMYSDLSTAPACIDIRRPVHVKCTNSFGFVSMAIDT